MSEIVMLEGLENGHAGPLKPIQDRRGSPAEGCWRPPAAESTTGPPNNGQEVRHNGSPGKPSFLGPIVSNEHTEASSGSSKHWDIVRKRFVNAVGASLNFRTLRDMYGDFMLDPQKMTFVKTLGEGNHGRVDKYRYVDASGVTCIAVKRLKSNMVTAQDMLDFMREVELLKKLRHECIASYRGSGTLPAEREDQEDDLYLAQECLEGGSLRDLVIEQMQNRHRKKYTLLDGCKWMLSVARGMAYLHNAEPVVIHRDLKLENIMLNTVDGRAKIVDFGLHKVIDRWERQYVRDEDGFYEMSGGMGAYIYMAPESLTSNRYNHLVDVYAFGIMLWELMHYEMLIYRVSLHGTTEEVKNFSKYVSRESWRPPISRDLPEGIVKLIEDCWEQNPSDRPEFKEVAGRLKEVIAELEADREASNPTAQHCLEIPDTHVANQKSRRCCCF